MIFCSKTWRTGLIPALLSLVMTPQTSAAPRFGEEVVEVRLGTFLSNINTDIGLTGPHGGNSSIDFEDVLGLDSTLNSFRADLSWRFAPRHRLMLGYYELRRSATHSAQRQFEIDDPDNGLIVINAGVSVTSKFNWRLIPISYAYSIAKNDKLELAGSLGVHWFDLGLGVSGLASVNGKAATLTTQSESASGPLPVVGLHADYALSPKWTIGAQTQFFSLSHDDYSGNLIDIRLRTEYWLSDSVGVALGYTWYNINLEKRLGLGFELSADYNYQGPEAYLSIRF